MNTSDFKIILSSDSGYDKLTAEMFYKDKFIALLNQDGGLDKLKIEFPSNDIDESMVVRNIDVSVLEKAIELATEKLK